jgi:peptidoglycan/xylan/chitin deacetylase (PgdA/CDA1 family)
MTSLTARERLKYAVKWTVAHALYGVGALQLWKRVALRRKAVVLAYHRVLPAGEASTTWSHPAIVVTRPTFERHARVLSKSFQLLTLGEFEARLQSGRPFQTASCLVTFDDGWSDTYSEAWPVLRRHAIPATVFVPAALIGTDHVFWQERLGCLLFETWQRARGDRDFASRARCELAGLGLANVLELAPSRARQEILSLVRTRKRNATMDPWESVAVVSDLLGADPAPKPNGDRLMSWSQAREMAREGVTFGGHGATHSILTALPPEAVREEVETARETLERELPAPVTAFSYPNGDWNREVADAVDGAHYRVAFSMRRGPVAAGSDHLAVCRINIHEDVTSSTPMFLARIVGLF